MNRTSFGQERLRMGKQPYIEFDGALAGNTWMGAPATLLSKCAVARPKGKGQLRGILKAIIAENRGDFEGTPKIAADSIFTLTIPLHRGVKTASLRLADLGESYADVIDFAAFAFIDWDHEETNDE